jgi:hypothetical protein
MLIKATRKRHPHIRPLINKSINDMGRELGNLMAEHKDLDVDKSCILTC